jgi:hypothetical protein
MIEKMADKLRVKGADVVADYLFTLELDTSAMSGTDEEKLRAIEAKFQGVLQASMEITTKRSDLPHDDLEWISDSNIVWPRRREGNNIIERVTTVGVRCNSIDPDGIVRDFTIWLGNGWQYQNHPANWWVN